MKTINITYDAMTEKEGKWETGETCLNITVMDDIAENLIKTGQSGIAMRLIDNILRNCEMLMGRTYIKGSIKDIREVKEK